MRILTIKNIPDELYELLKEQAAANRRSLNSEVIVLIERAVGSPRLSDEAILERANLLREKTRGYMISEEEMKSLCAAAGSGEQLFSL
jgi:plasmid stability protein